MPEAEKPPKTERVWSSRKFVSAWCLTWILTALLWWGKLDANAYATCVSFIWVGYFAGNIGEKWVATK
jgi:hypothetical protein